MYEVFQVVLFSEDRETVLSDWLTRDLAIDEVARIKQHYGDGQYLLVIPVSRGF